MGEMAIGETEYDPNDGSSMGELDIEDDFEDELEDEMEIGGRKRWEAHSDCGKYATCNERNKVCYCRGQYFGDGVTCLKKPAWTLKPKKRCSSDSDCGERGYCHKTKKCYCDRGLWGDGVRCEHMDPCKRADYGGCGKNANCRQVLGKAICSCHAGYKGDGYKCTKAAEMEMDVGASTAETTFSSNFLFFAVIALAGGAGYYYGTRKQVSDSSNLYFNLNPEEQIEL